MKLAGVSAIALLLTSCVGVGVVGGKKDEHGSFGVNETGSKPMRRLTEARDGKNPTRQEVRSSWGDPDRQSEKDGEDIWSYESGLALRGAVPMLGIGIPLVVPVGKNSYDFHFPRGEEWAGKMVVNENQFKGGYFGVSAFSNSKGFGFHKLGE